MSLSHSEIAYFEIDGEIVQMPAAEAANMARSFKPVTGWADLLGRRVTALFDFKQHAFLAFEDAYAEFSGGQCCAGVYVEKVAIKRPKNKPQKDKRSHQTRLREAIGGSVVAMKPINDAVLFTLTNGAVVHVGVDVEGPYLIGGGAGELLEQLP